jgi:hypothetical protein
MDHHAAMKAARLTPRSKGRAASGAPLSYDVRQHVRDLGAFSAQQRFFLVQAAYGKAMLEAHGLERTLGALLICQATFSADDGPRREARIARVNRLPLGRLIEEFVEALSPDKHLIEELDNLLFFRNELAHRISDTILGAAAQSNWEQRVVAELEEIRSYFVEAKPLLEAYMETFLVKIGITESQMMELMRKLYSGVA